MRTKIAKSLMWKTQRVFYSVVNFITLNTVKGFFSDVIYMGSAAMLSVLSLILVGVAVYFLAAGGLSILRHQWADAAQIAVALLVMGLALVCDMGARFLLSIAPMDDEQDG